MIKNSTYKHTKRISESSIRRIVSVDIAEIAAFYLSLDNGLAAWGLQKRNFVHNTGSRKKSYKINPPTLSFKKKVTLF